MLSRRLRWLEHHGIIARRLYTDHPPRAEYVLTERGSELRTVVRALTIWGSKHLPGERVLVHAACEQPIEMAYRCARCDETLAPEHIAYRTESVGRKRVLLKRRSSSAAARPAQRKTRP